MKNKMIKRMTIMLVVVGLVFAAIVGYQMFVASMMKKYLASNAHPPATVTAIEVGKSLWQPQFSAVGNLRAVQGVDISSEIAGMVKRIHVKSGDVVKQGDLLLELSSDEELAQLQALQSTRKLAEITFKRDQRQFKIHAISKAQLDISKAELSTRIAQEAMQLALIDKKRIKAPFSGRLGVIRISEGQYLNPAVPIMTLQNSKTLFVDFNLPQKYLATLKKGQLIAVDAKQQGVDILRGEISAINSSVDSNTRNVLIEGKIENPDGVLLPGMFVSLSIDAGEAQQLLTLPQTAISYNAYGSTLFVAKAQPDAKPSEAKKSDAEKSDAPAALIAQQLFIKTGEKRGDQISILEGLKEGDMVVTSGQLKLKNGTPLIIDNAVEPANDAAPKPQEH